MTERLVEDPVGRQRYVFRRVEDKDGGEVLQFDGWVDPGGNVPPHFHPSQEERFEIVEGEMMFTVGRRKRRAGPGETVVMAPGTRHAFRNAGHETIRMRVEARPPQQLQEFLEDTAALGRAGHVVRLGRLRLPHPRGVTPGAVMLRRYRDTVVVLLPGPIVQRFLLDPLARRAERRGYTRPA
jgi:quercetin dioxygenase-like cupin family protein